MAGEYRELREQAGRERAPAAEHDAADQPGVRRGRLLLPTLAGQEALSQRQLPVGGHLLPSGRPQLPPQSRRPTGG